MLGMLALDRVDDSRRIGDLRLIMTYGGWMTCGGNRWIENSWVGAILIGMVLAWVGMKKVVGASAADG